MTPKEKAKELYNKFNELLPCEGLTTGETPILCALIAVDEIRSDELEIMPGKWMDDYWKEVKDELFKL